MRPTAQRAHLQAHLIDTTAVDTLHVFGPTVQLLTEPDDNAPCVMRGVIPPHGIVPLHSHADPETFIALSGTMEGFNGVGWEKIAAGAVFHVPGGARHAFRNSGGQPAVSIVVSTARLGRFFRDIGQAGAPRLPPSPEDVARFLAVADRYGYWNATPEENEAIGLKLPPL